MKHAVAQNLFPGYLRNTLPFPQNSGRTFADKLTQTTKSWKLYTCAKWIRKSP